MIEFHKPELRFFRDVTKDNNQGKLVLEPLQRGYGQTLGQAIRSVLITAMPGVCIRRVKIAGIDHRFSAVPGVKEKVRQILLNLNKVIFATAVQGDKGTHELKLTVSASSGGETEVTAGNFSGAPLEGETPALRVVNPDALVCTFVDAKAKFDMTVEVTSGRGYVMADPSQDSGGWLVLNQHYTPVVRASFEIEDARVGQDINFDRLTLDVETNGAVSPEDAVKYASRLYGSHFEPVVNIPVKSEFPEEEFRMIREERRVENKNLDISIKELEFSVRSRNCLEQENIRTLGELAMKRASELLAIKNFGKKSLNEIRDKLAQYGLSLADEDVADHALGDDDDLDGDDDDSADLMDVEGDVEAEAEVEAEGEADTEVDEAGAEDEE